MSLMSDEQIVKKTFVDNELAEMLCMATGGYVARVEYFLQGGDELVTVTCEPCRYTSDVFTVNVSCDSLWAIAKDVMRAVARHYE